MKMRVPTIEELRDRLSYNPETGALVWRKARSARRVGSEAKSLDVAGYIQVSFGGNCIHKGHRIAWAIHHGKWPSGPIDHINGARSDNRIKNLREVDHQVNCQNVRLGSMVNQSTGFLGVYKADPSKERYRAKIQFNGVQHHIGTFGSAEEAHAAYVEAKRKLHVGCTI